MQIHKSYVIALPMVLMLSGCLGSSQHRDLHAFMEESRQQTGGEIEPLPTPKPYTTFAYTVKGRSPFEQPIPLASQRELLGKSAVKPDENRKREYLEGINFAELNMVGTLSRDNQIWALIDDGNGGVHRVRVGNYLGKNHGQIKSVSRSEIKVIEIRPDGQGGWLEMPRTLALREKE
ncbi:pilus assembly protein PilP [Porticoccaceae bacterium LTM1]|nr:pilus assembly protein PilP [Porticoccaceae bacterium LTM1]